MTTPSLTRVKIIKFMVTRINEPLTMNDLIYGSQVHGRRLLNELHKLSSEGLITIGKNNWKMTFDNASMIADNHTDLAVVCNFYKVLKKKNKELSKQI